MDKNTIDRVAEVIVPFAVKGTFSYKIKDRDLPLATIGMRVEVNFGKNKIYTGIIKSLRQQGEDEILKEINQFLDPAPIVSPLQIKFWEWIAGYYLCSIGQVMNAALPANLKIQSETKVKLSPFYQEDLPGLSHHEYIITESLNEQGELSVKDLQAILGMDSISHIIKNLINLRLIYVKEKASDKYKARIETYITWSEEYAKDLSLQEMAFELCKRSDRQQKALLFFLENADQDQKLPRRVLSKQNGLDSSVVKAIVKKGIWKLEDIALSRLNTDVEETLEAPELSDNQKRALKEIKSHFKTKNTCLLHGVTGSGKTQIYIELIKEVLKREEQTLYLLPEIALTTQLVNRLQLVFGEQVFVYHSRLNQQERVELYKRASEGKGIFIGARSSIFLPFSRLKLIVIDESHDSSFKQQDPAPRYNGRDAAVYLAHICGAKTLMGTATPSIESYTNARQGKYGLVELLERFGKVELPDIELIDLGLSYRQNRMKQQFSKKMIDGINDCLERKKQVIVFQNRRGYAPRLQCQSCGEHQSCPSCDISLTYHKYKNTMNCHYCGHSEAPLTTCKKCHKSDMKIKGFGTEKLEEDLSILFPDATIDRMDMDSSRSKKAHARIINKVESGEVDILVGTQMVSKGLDFENMEMVCVANADQMIRFPDFRSGERAFQLLTQVAGRAGRRGKKGRVFIQSFDIEHPVLKEVLNNDYHAMYEREMQERRMFNYPPFSKLIRIQLKHRDNSTLTKASHFLKQALLSNIENGVMGPAIPAIGRINNLYIQEFLIKLPLQAAYVQKVKRFLQKTESWLKKQDGCSSVRVILDCDVY